MRLRAAIVLAFTTARLSLPAATESLENVLERMDRAASSFKALSADVKSVQHTAVINDDNIDIGRMLLKRSKRDMRMLVEFTQPDPKAIAIQGHKVEIYYPKRNVVEEYDIGERRDLLNQFLLIGFGTSGKELSSAYNIRVLGDDTVAGQITTHLELVPKSPEVLKNLKKLELWIPESEGYPIQQKFYLAAGDYKLVTYTNVKVNPPLTDGDLKLKVPKDAKRVFPQK
jgi:outer membrane lipoprotein-sorting protein